MDIYVRDFEYNRLGDLLTKYCSVDKISKMEMSGVCSAYGGVERRIQVFGGET